jgi:hypothetical protein
MNAREFAIRNLENVALGSDDLVRPDRRSDLLGDNPEAGLAIEVARVAHLGEDAPEIAFGWEPGVDLKEEHKLVDTEVSLASGRLHDDIPAIDGDETLIATDTLDRRDLSDRRQFASRHLDFGCWNQELRRCQRQGIVWWKGKFLEDDSKAAGQRKQSSRVSETGMRANEA